MTDGKLDCQCFTIETIEESADKLLIYEQIYIKNKYHY